MAYCKSCKATIMWVEMQGSGKRCPVNPSVDPLKGTLVIIGRTHEGTPIARVAEPIEHTSGARLYVSHFATCPKAAEHRKQPERAADAHVCVQFEGGRAYVDPNASKETMDAIQRVIDVVRHMSPEQLQQLSVTRRAKS